jgi:hypothetical protein
MVALDILRELAEAGRRTFYPPDLLALTYEGEEP